MVDNKEKEIRFKKQCRKFGLDWNKVIDYDGYRGVSTLNNKYIVIFNSNNQVIGVEEINHSIDDIVGSKISIYESELLGMPFPFTGYSLKNITDLSNCINVSMNKIYLNDKQVENPIVKGILAYLKVLGSEIDDYYFRVYPLILQNNSVPDLANYVSSFSKSMDVRNLKDSVNTLRNMGLWYEKRDRYNYLISLMIDTFDNNYNDNYISELCINLKDKVEEKNKEFIKK